MIFYRPTDGDPYQATPALRPRTCFLMTQLGDPLPGGLELMHDSIREVCGRREFSVCDAGAVVTGKDFLLKIWELVLSVPLGIAVLHEDMATKTVANIFYELGLMQAYGKETLVVKTPGASIPSDFVRTEYLTFGDAFPGGLEQFLDYLITERAPYFTKMAAQLENNPLLSIDYLRRAYLISGDEANRAAIEEIRDQAGFEGRAGNSVEMLATELLLAQP